MGVTNMYRVTCLGTGVAGSPYYMTGYFDSAGGTPQQASTDWFTFLNTGASGLRTGYTITSPSAVDSVDPVSGNLVATFPTTPASVVGTDSTLALPPASQALARWRTGVFLNGREIRGRTSIPGFTQGSSGGGGVPSSTFVTAINTKIAALIGSTNSKHVVWSKLNGQWAETTIGSCWGQWAVLRSRRD